MNALELTGRVETHVIALEAHPYRDGRGFAFRVHREVAAPFLALCDAARNDGIEIQLVSAFRSFEHQAKIWQAKASGARPLYAEDGGKLDYTQLSAEQLLHGILRWSALPGASRHHWGSDLDIIDAAPVKAGYTPQLLPEEFAPGAPFYALKCWLDKHAAAFGFFHPYAEFQGGVAAEPWHISYAPVSEPALALLDEALIASAVLEYDIALKELVLRHLPQLSAQYIRNIKHPI